MLCMKSEASAKDVRPPIEWSGEEMDQVEHEMGECTCMVENMWSDKLISVCSFGAKNGFKVGEPYPNQSNPKLI
jgi:hypothetical protein